MELGGQTQDALMGANACLQDIVDANFVSDGGDTFKMLPCSTWLWFVR